MEEKVDEALEKLNNIEKVSSKAMGALEDGERDEIVNMLAERRISAKKEIDGERFSDRLAQSIELLKKILDTSFSPEASVCRREAADAMVETVKTLKGSFLH